MSTVAIRPQLLRWARERAGLDATDLTRQFPRFQEWERGEASPTLRQLEALAKKTLTPLGYFFLPEPPEDRLPIPDFRTVGDQPVRRPSPNLLETVQIMQRRQDWMQDYVAELGQPPLDFIGSATLTDSPADVARSIRATLGVTDGWARREATWTDALRSLRGMIEEVGIVVVVNGVVGNNNFRKLDPNEFRGFVLSDRFAPLIFVNGADAKSAQMFTFAHELAHLWLGRDGVFNLPDLQPANDAVELFCNKVAAEFLVPEEEFLRAWPQAAQTAEPFQSLAGRFKVSPLVAARRALDLQVINRAEFFSFFEAYQADERRRAQARAGGGDFYATQEVRIGRRFGAAVVRAAREGRLLFKDAYQLTGLYGQTFDRFAEGIGLQLR
ncbi:MAG: ImmA/IrrE family metallo-endopeptidase [Opitutaceae bacterium]|nr:ImmA/IrrE family metallo-endopeptidase [Opitutaceae bacterium]